MPDTPDTRGKALHASQEAEARLAQLQRQRQRRQQQQASLLSGGVVVSPEEERHPQEHVSQAVVPPADLDVVPDTVARPCLAGLPQAAAAAAAAAAGLGGGQLMHSPPMRLDFGECHAAALRMHAVPARQSGIQYCPTGCDHNINACLPPPCAAAVPGAILPSQQTGAALPCPLLAPPATGPPGWWPPHALPMPAAAAALRWHRWAPWRLLRCLCWISHRPPRLCWLSSRQRRRNSSSSSTWSGRMRAAWRALRRRQQTRQLL